MVVLHLGSRPGILFRPSLTALVEQKVILVQRTKTEKEKEKNPPRPGIEPGSSA